MADSYYHSNASKHPVYLA